MSSGRKDVNVRTGARGQVANCPLTSTAFPFPQFRTICFRQKSAPYSTR